MTSLLKNKKVRDITLQVSFVGSIVLLLCVFFITAKTNLDAQGITSGFGFLDRATGWQINFSLIEYGSSSTYFTAIKVGIINSLFVGFISLILATLLGFTIGAMRTSGNGMAELIGAIFVEIFRNIPLLLQLFFWYALLISLPNPKATQLVFDSVALTGRGVFIPGLNITSQAALMAASVATMLIGIMCWVKITRRFNSVSFDLQKTLLRVIPVIGLVAVAAIIFLGRIPDTSLVNVPYLKGLNYKEGIRISPELLACIIAISIYGASYIAEIIRAGFNAVGKGQSEAGYALGLSRWHIFTRIRLPLAIRIVMPTMINQYVWLFKATTIGIAVGFVDFFMVISTSINQSGQTLELIGILMGVFLAINYSIAWLLNRVNDAIKLQGTQLRI